MRSLAREEKMRRQVSGKSYETHEWVNGSFLSQIKQFDEGIKFSLSFDFLHLYWTLVFLPRTRQYCAREYENGVLFLRLGLPSTLLCHENGVFRKRSRNPRNLKTPALRLVWTENILQTKYFKDEDIRINMLFSWQSLLKHKLCKMIHDCSVFKFLWRSWTWD